MAKMFYTLDEVKAKLGKSEDEIKKMVSSGQIQEFRDRDRLMFKKEAIDMYLGDKDETGEVRLELEDSRAGSGLDLQADSSMGMVDSREGTGISVFDTDHGGEDAGDQTQAGTIEEELSLESVGSGSGLLDLTRESDDTSLGAELLEEVYSSDDANVEIPANASGLFEAAGAESPGNVMTEGSSMPMLVESYDGAGSGLGAGLMIAALVSLVCAGIIAVVGVSGATPGLAMSFASNLMVWGGVLLAITIIFGLVGLFIGKASE